MPNHPSGHPLTTEVGYKGATPTDSPVLPSLKQKAQELATHHSQLRHSPAPAYLLQRLPQQALQLEAAYHAFAHPTHKELVYSAAAEWLLDNYYVVEQTLRQIKEDLPLQYYQELPQLNAGSDYTGYPRVYALAHYFTLEEKCQFERQSIQRFVLAYQEVTPLTMGELWALPLMLRLVVLESLTQALGRLTETTLPPAETLPAALICTCDIRDEEMVANCILSLRMLINQNWSVFFETISPVEQILRQDPVALYGQMDFETRDHYRKVIEKLALGSQQSEATVAQAAVQLAYYHVISNHHKSLADEVWSGLQQPRLAHVGYYLLDKGRAQLEKQIGYQPGVREQLSRGVMAYPTFVYLGAIMGITGVITAAATVYAYLSGGTLGPLLLVFALSLIPASAIAISLVNWLVTMLVRPHVLPKLDFSEGVPDQCRTMVVIPAMLTDAEEVESLFRQLELHYLRNPDPQLGFALLTDFADAPQMEMPTDKALLEQAQSCLEILNQRYPRTPFYLLHRCRLWNPAEGAWMGWERKRGKLEEFNGLLRGRTDTSFVVQNGVISFLTLTKYVITLDADSILPRNAAARLIGTLAHPLNQAQFDPQRQKVIAGYTILQPRTEIHYSHTNQSLFTRVFGGDVGLDLYTLAVSDVYQDLFAEGTYVGKGIYDVDTFVHSLTGRTPQNRLLSHDLFEGIQGRVGLVTDVVLYEDFPTHYLIYIRRSHRWIRGDWQLLPWLLPLIPTEAGWRRNNLSALGLWKIADNLRRSLLSPALFLLFLAGWLLLPGSPFFWSLFGLLASAITLVISTLTGIVRGINGATWAEIRRPIRNGAIRWLLHIAFLSFEALLVVDAVLMTLWRLLISRRNLLQWTTAAHTARLFGQEMTAAMTLTQMGPSVLVTALVCVLVVLLRPQALLIAVPIMLLWVLASDIAYRVSKPNIRPPEQLTTEQIYALRSLARRTWLFFEQFVGPADNWLPPDHFQEWPRGTVAHRTSPTNVGLYLLSLLAAYDLGYISTMNLILRLGPTFDTLAKLERYRGHFLNWIETDTLRPLPPRYVSTVDSGNLAACLLVVQQACRELGNQSVWRWERWQGLLDTMALLEQALQGTAETIVAPLREQIDLIRQQVVAEQNHPEQWASLVLNLVEVTEPELEQCLITLVDTHLGQIEAETIQSWRIYAERLRQHIQGMRREMEMLLPWLFLLCNAPPTFYQPDTPEPILQAWQRLCTILYAMPQLNQVATVAAAAHEPLKALQAAITTLPTAPEAEIWCQQLAASLSNTTLTIRPILTHAEELARQAGSYANEMEFAFLFDPQRRVFHIGYNLERGRLDDSYYDLLASEARIASLIAIAKGDVPLRHWLHLARPLTRFKGRLALLSWSGTMFEYLMPPLLMRQYPGTLLAESMEAVVAYQIAYGEEQKIPWGISESGFYTFDNAQNYQYRAFGVPGLGFKRGLGEDLVVTPYASLLALPLRPQAVMQNLHALSQKGMMGRYGFYEAIDFTASRLQFGQEWAIVRSYMAHHQGMIMLSLLNYLQADKMVSRFHAEPRIHSVELLLQEKIPPQPTVEQPPAEDEGIEVVRPPQSLITATPWSVPAETPMPLIHFLSNGRLSSLITNAGSGALMGPDVAYTRWRPDTTLDNWGNWLYVQDRERNSVWSLGIQPFGHHAERYEVQFYPHMAHFHRHHEGIALELDIVVAINEDVEIRRVRLTNDNDQPRHLRLTSYAEVVLTDQASDQRHQAFAKLFVESEYVAELNALFFRRRPRAAAEAPRFLATMLVMEEGIEPTRAYETDRAYFCGRGGMSHYPTALTSATWLRGTTGATLDPIMSLGQDIQLQPRTSVELAFLTFTASSRADLLALGEQYRRWVVINRAFTAARSQAEQELRQLELPITDLEQIQQMLSLLLYPHPARRAAAATLAANQQGQSGLWAFGLSGDYPILLLHLSDENNPTLLRTVLQAHRYWRRRGLKIDLIILNQQDSNYSQALQGYIHRLIRHMESDHWLNRRGGIFVLLQDQLTPPTKILLQTVARVILDASAGSLRAQLGDLQRQPGSLPRFVPTLMTRPGQNQESTPLPRPGDLQFDNGLGGFSPDGKEYLIYLEPGQSTPAPWINVIANETFGCLVTESGGGYTWADNSGENRLTTWRNDPVTDCPAEALYLRDEETGEIWSPTPQPAPAPLPYLVRHGAGYTSFAHQSHGLKQDLLLFIAATDPIKVVQLRLENTTTRPRRLTITFYAEWVLGTNREITQPYLVPYYHAECQGLLVRNPYSPEFADKVAFAAANKSLHGLTADRTEFLGRLGDMRRPAALHRIGLNSQIEAGLDPCAAIQIHVDLAPGANETVYFLLGQGANEAEAVRLVQTYQRPECVAAAWQEIQTLWDDILGTVQVETPDPAMNLLLNHWLLYQTIACRLWGRSALYQSSGAYGFRDQLQDVMAVLYARPALAREHLLRAARHQFETGDVLHWWHPPGGRGVRTRISDDLAWLPYVTAHYVRITGDTSVLEERVPFLIGDPLTEEEEERYGQYETTLQTYTLYEHCCRALTRATTKGVHGLPLIGTGDWNDGMNRVGREGVGESIWLGWFLIGTLNDFAPLCITQGDEAKAKAFRQQGEAYQEAIEQQGWDGEWYRRGYYDDGTPLGSRQNTECRIDAIAQSWGVLTGAANPERATQAMQAVWEQLVRAKERLILLFTPPFDQTRKDPGYIKGYLPGIRENGGQYTHAALWTIWAFAALEDGDTTEYLFRLINPIYQADTPEGVARYKAEPYVIAADVYGVRPHEGRGGWTWYTGSSGWMYRLGIEGILGLRQQGNRLYFNPCVPPTWEHYRFTYRFRQTTYDILIENPGLGHGIKQLTLDGIPLPEKALPLQDDGQHHHVVVQLAQE